METTEIWKPVHGLEGLYEISNMGNIMSIRRNKRIKPYMIKGGYMVVCLCNGFRIHRLVHRLVWEAFNGPIPHGMEINHINEITGDNRLCNLNILSHKDNVNYGTGNNRRRDTNLSKEWTTVIMSSKQGEFIRRFRSLSEAERETGIRHGHISEVCRGKWKTAGGFKWSYEPPQP